MRNMLNVKYRDVDKQQIKLFASKLKLHFDFYYFFFFIKCGSAVGYFSVFVCFLYSSQSVTELDIECRI